MGIEQPQFRPVATPIDTVAVRTRLTKMPEPVAPVIPVAPSMGPLPTPPAPSNVNQLVNSLAAFSNSLGTFLATRDKKIKEEEGTEAELRAIRDNVNTWGEAVAADPTLADKSPYFRQMYEARVARTRVQKLSMGLAAEYTKSPIAASDDPSAISSWLAERMKDTIDSAQTPAEREAMLDEVKRISGSFMAVHQKTALGNLYYNNLNSFGTAVQDAVGEVAIRGGFRAYKTDDPVLKGEEITPTKAAFLNAISGGESGGQYNIRYDGPDSKGATFDINAPHPKIFRPGPAGSSSAAGRYQITHTTWTGIHGGQNPAMTPENQDRTALTIGESTYRRVTGRDLWADLETEGFSPRIQKALAPTWAALHHNQGRHAETFRQTRERWSQGGSGDTSGVYMAARQTIQKIEEDGRMQGIDQKTLDATVVSAVVAEATRRMDPELLDLALQPRADGSPGAGMTIENRAQIDKAKIQINALRNTEDDNAEKLQKKQRENAARNIKSIALEILQQQQEAKQPFKLPEAMLADARKHDPDLYKDLIDIQKNAGEQATVRNAPLVHMLNVKSRNGELSHEQVFDHLTANDIGLDEAKQLTANIANRTKNTLATDSTVSSFITTATNQAGKYTPVGGYADYGAADFISDKLTSAAIAFERTNPNADVNQMIEHLRKVKETLFTEHLPDHDVTKTMIAGKPQGMFHSAPAKPTEGEQKKSSPSAPAAPNSGTKAETKKPVNPVTYFQDKNSEARKWLEAEKAKGRQITPEVLLEYIKAHPDQFPREASE